MSEVPQQINSAEVRAYLILDHTHVRTGNTKHYVDGELLQHIYGLAICQFSDDNGYYLYYCDSSWNEITDTYHDTIEDVIVQAEFEYTNTSKAWTFFKQENGA